MYIKKDVASVFISRNNESISTEVISITASKTAMQSIWSAFFSMTILSSGQFILDHEFGLSRGSKTDRISCNLPESCNSDLGIELIAFRSKVLAFCRKFRARIYQSGLCGKSDVSIFTNSAIVLEPHGRSLGRSCACVKSVIQLISIFLLFAFSLAWTRSLLLLYLFARSNGTRSRVAWIRGRGPTKH